MGPLQRPPGTAPTAFSQDPPWLRRRERISLVKNRMREICTSGSVRDGDGNAPIYSAVDALELGEGTVEDRLIGERGKRSRERQAAERGLELLQEQSSEKLGSTCTGRKKPGRQAIQRAPSLDRPPPGTRQ